MTVPLKDIFLKDINRHIDGVIKADDTERRPSRPGPSPTTSS